ETVEQVRAGLHPSLIIHGIVLTMHDARNNLSNQVVADVRQHSGQKVYDTLIPRNVRVSEAPSFGKPVLVYDLKCVGSEAYLRLPTEVIQREKELINGGVSAPPASEPSSNPASHEQSEASAGSEPSEPTQTIAHSTSNPPDQHDAIADQVPKPHEPSDPD